MFPVLKLCLVGMYSCNCLMVVALSLVLLK